MQDPETMTGEGGLQPARGTANRGTEAWPSHPPPELHPALRPDHGIGHHYPLPETQGVFPDSKPHLQPTCESWAFAHKSPQTWALGHLHPPVPTEISASRSLPSATRALARDAATRP